MIKNESKYPKFIKIIEVLTFKIEKMIKIISKFIKHSEIDLWNWKTSQIIPKIHSILKSIIDLLLQYWIVVIDYYFDQLFLVSDLLANCPFNRVWMKEPTSTNSCSPRNCLLYDAKESLKRILTSRRSLTTENWNYLHHFNNFTTQFWVVLSRFWRFFFQFQRSIFEYFDEIWSFFEFHGSISQ